MSVSRTQVLRYRVHAQQLDRPTERRTARPTTPRSSTSASRTPAPTARCGRSRVRGVPVTRARTGRDELALAWTVRAAPHAYRRADLPAVEKALRPYSEADAAKRVINASGPLAAAGIPVLDALATVSRTMREVVDRADGQGRRSPPG